MSYEWRMGNKQSRIMSFLIHRYRILVWGCLLGLFLGTSPVSAQQLQFPTNHDSLQVEVSSLDLPWQQPAPLLSSLDILPQYVKQNPAGHSYLCRLEVAIEKKWPVAIWVRAGESTPIRSYNENNLFLQVKLLNLR